MKLEVYNKDDKLMFTLDNDEALLGSYHVDDYMRIHVRDEMSQTLDDREIHEKHNACVIKFH